MIAAAILCLVVGVHDGDTLTCLTDDKTQIKVRLAEIDAPELRQPYGYKSKQSLSDMCFKKQAELRPQAIDRYRRTVARVICEGTDANAEQVRLGMAWVYVKYSKDASLPPLQDTARAAGIGLWADPDPIPPWSFRHRKDH